MKLMPAARGSKEVGFTQPLIEKCALPTRFPAQIRAGDYTCLSVAPRLSLGLSQPRSLARSPGPTAAALKSGFSLARLLGVKSLRKWC